MLRKSIAALVALSCAAAVLADDSDEIHIANGSSVSSLNLTDGANFRWDIVNNGVVNDGSSDAYDGGMSLTINGSNFYNNNQGKLSADKREMEIGPYQNGQMRVWRRIYVDAKKGYCRWIDIFENSSSSSMSVTLQYYTNTGGTTQQIYTTSGKSEMTDKDWGVVTGHDANSSNPSLVHILASKGSKLKPKFRGQINDDNMYYNLTLNVPARKTVALCFFECQRKTYVEAKKALDDFNVSTEMEKVPASLRKIIVNMAGGTVTMLGRIELTRNEKLDLAILRNGDELLGDLDVQSYELQTVFGKISLEPARVLGLLCPDADEPVVQVALADGQVVVGKLLSAPLKIKLANGGEMSLQPDKVKMVSYRLSKERPDEIASHNPAVVLRTGQQLFFNKSDGEYTFQSEYGEFKLSADDLAGLSLDTPDGGLHRAMFRNGSMLSGLLKAPAQKLKLDLGPTLDAPTSMIEQFIFPLDGEEDRRQLTEVTLRNEDTLQGELLEESLTIESRQGKAVIKPDDVAELQFLPDSLGQVQVKLLTGTTITGRLANQTLKFRITPGPELSLYAGHVTRMTFPPPSARPKAATSSSSPATASSEPAAPSAADADKSSPSADARPADARSADEARKLAAEAEAMKARAVAEDRERAAKDRAEKMKAANR